jgi:uncharacterized protein (TIGR03437 family)
MSRQFFYTLLIALSLTLGAAAQNFDTGGDSMLKGQYFVREILIAGQNDDANGTITSAASVMGVVTFNGSGNYSFSGTTASTASPGTSTPQVFTGTYEVGSNGLLGIQSLADPTQTSYGGVSAIGPSAFVASATEGTSVDIMVAIPAGSNASAASLKGPYSTGFIDFLNADVTMVREATMSLNADGAGNFGSVAVSGTAANLGATPTNQTVSAVTYTLNSTGSGMVNFGSASSAQLISGSKTLYISADGNIVIGGNPAGFDLMVGIRGLTAPASNATSSGEYYVAAIENQLTGASPANTIDGFYGSLNATGQGASITHNRFQTFLYDVYDYTYDNTYNVLSNGTYNDGAFYQYSLGVNGQAFVATGINGLYSLMVGFGAPQFSASGVYLNPLGVVNAASFAPITNPIAPGEVITLFGSGLAASNVNAPSVPLPTTLGNTQVTINGTAAPLYYVTPTQIAAFVPQAITPYNGVNYATVQVVNNGMKSNPVTVLVNYTAPGVPSATANGIGPALAQHAGYALITSSDPATVGETIVVYGVGLGAVSPAVGDGAPAPSNPPSQNTDTDYVDFSNPNDPGNLLFAGLTPGLAGLYQMNVTIPSGTSSGNVTVDISTPDAYTQEATISVAGAGANAQARSVVELSHQRPKRAKKKSLDKSVE